MVEGREIIGLLKDWQTLITGIMALLAAWIGARAIRETTDKQIANSNRQWKEEIKRNEIDKQKTLQDSCSSILSRTRKIDSIIGEWLIYTHDNDFSSNPHNYIKNHDVDKFKEAYKLIREEESYIRRIDKYIADNVDFISDKYFNIMQDAELITNKKDITVMDNSNIIHISNFPYKLRDAQQSVGALIYILNNVIDNSNHATTSLDRAVTKASPE